LKSAEHSKVTRRASVFSLATIISRALGLVRDMFIANFFGSTLISSAFFVSYAIPNMMRRLLGEGALSGALVPVFSDSLKKEGHEKSVELANTIATITALALVLFVVIFSGILWLLDAIFNASPDLYPKLYYVVRLGQVMMPYMFFICLCGVWMGVLNTFHHYFVPAILPALMNLFLVLAVIFVCPKMGDTKPQQIFGLAVTVLAAGCIQLGLLHFPLKAKGVRYRPKLDWRNPYVSRFLALFFPAFLALSVTSINMVIDNLLAFFVLKNYPSAPSELYYANRLVQLPLGVFGIALATVLLPTLSRLHTAGNMDAYKKTYSYSLRQVMSIAIPAMVGILVLRTEIVALIYQRGEFTQSDTAVVSQVLMCYAFGLLPFFAVKITTPAFLAMHDAKTPMRLVLIATGVNIVLNLILMFPLQSRGFALATSIASGLNLYLLLGKLRERIGAFDWRGLINSAMRITAASILMGVVVIFATAATKKVFDFSVFSGKLITVMVGIGCGIFTFFIAAMIFKVREVNEIMTAFRNNKIK
jgi:putative peptidoglycan lipid II flippase